MSLPNTIVQYQSTSNKTTVVSMYSSSDVIDALDCSGLTIQSMHIIPGLSQTVSWNSSTQTYSNRNSFIPQGICTAGNFILITAYDGGSSNELNSVIYMIDKNTYQYITTIITPGKSHMGGIIYDTGNSFIWYSNGTSISGFPYSWLTEIRTAYNNDATGTTSAFRLKNTARTFSTLTQASYITYFDDLIWVGEYKEWEIGSTTPLIYGYSCNPSSSSLSTVYMIEAPHYVQGMAFYKKNNNYYLALTTSYGVTTSHVHLYNTSYTSPVPISGQSYQQINKNTAYEELDFPHGLENVCRYSSSTYIIFESAKVYSQVPFIDKVDRYIRYNSNDFYGLT